jgi:uncharacterized RDD family membrane protein YckC
MATCPSCGTTNVEGTKFCVSCGATIAPDPGAWRAGTAELNNQPSSGLGAPTGSDYSSSPYNTPTSGALYSQPGGASAAIIPPGGMNYALWADRVIAALIDAGLAAAIMIALYIVLIILTTAVAGIGGAVSPDAGGVLGCGGCCMWIVLPPVSYFVIGLLNKVFWVSSRGYSMGQGMMKLKVVDEKGQLLSTSTALIRLLATVGLAFIPFVGGFLDLLWPLWDPQRQTLHDKAVGSFVVKTE